MNNQQQFQLAADTESDEDDRKRPNPFPFSESEDIVLPEDYATTKHDVINGRGRKSYNHIANRRFRQLIAMNLTRYLAARCKVDKTLVVVGIVNTIRNSTPTGGFLKRCPKKGRWVSMSDESAREKVGHCLRDMIASQRDDKKGGAKSGSKGTSAKVELPPLAGTAAATASDKKPRSPVANPWMNGGNPAVALSSSLQAPVGGVAPFANMWSSIKNDTTSNNDSRNQGPVSSMPPLSAAQGSRAPDPPPAVLPLNLNNLDTITLQKGNLQDMSEQQRKILIKLEGGFQGSVEELMEAVGV